MKNLWTALLLVASMVVGGVVLAEGTAADATDMQALRTAVKSDRKAYVASMLQLTDAEAKKFWPLYDAYQRAVNVANRERAVTLEDVIEANKPISDLYAKSLAKDLVAADETEVRARRKLYNGLMRALPAKKAARYLQLEAKIRAVQAYDIASTFPLIK